MPLEAYLDNNATTALDHRVAAFMMEDPSFFLPSNPSSIHFLGQQAKNKLTKARQSIASALGVKPQEILFTSGGTESMNFLIQGLIRPFEKSRILSSSIEHACIEKTLLSLQQQGHEVCLLPSTPEGNLSEETIAAKITPNTFLVFSAVNSETGVKQDLDMLSRIALRHQVPLLIDGVALLGKESLTFIPPGITGMGFSAHKFHGPKGVGFAFLRSATKITPLIFGGGQEYGLRSGTENLTQILGLQKALQLVQEEILEISPRIKTLRDFFEQSLINHFPSIQINGNGPRICNVSNLFFPKIDAETLLIQLDQHKIAASHGSACSAGSLEPSRVLLGMGFDRERVKSSIRFSLSRFTTKEEIDYTLDVLFHLLPQLSPSL